MSNHIVLPPFSKSVRYQFFQTSSLKGDPGSRLYKADSIRIPTEITTRPIRNLPAQFQIIWDKNANFGSLKQAKKFGHFSN